MEYTLDDVITIGPKEQIFSRFLLGDIIIMSMKTMPHQCYYARLNNRVTVFEPDPSFDSLVLPKFEELKSYYEKVFDEDMQINMDHKIDSSYVWPCRLDTFKELYKNWEESNKQ